MFFHIAEYPSTLNSESEPLLTLNPKWRPGLEVLPLKVEETYPPSPPWGPLHSYDKEGEARWELGK